ncbi:MAG: hypothetical protein J7M21_01980 [Planctomycetes bacterium]|nr:hypothetical protein [Planctomycetota bacterium]
MVRVRLGVEPSGAEAHSRQWCWGTEGTDHELPFDDCKRAGRRYSGFPCARGRFGTIIHVGCGLARAGTVRRATVAGRFDLKRRV